MKYLRHLYVQVLIAVILGCLFGYYCPDQGASLEPLAKGFMELHGGTLSLESVIDEGTRVVLVFPPDRTIAPPISA